VTLDCQAVNQEIYATHEPIPTTDELRHSLSGSDRFSTLDMTNCYYQFEIEECARKLYAFRTPWGIYRYKRMVQGTSPASSEVQKRIRKTICSCSNAIHIKDDILVHGAADMHDKYLKTVLEALQIKGITLRPDKCYLGKTEVKWFGNIYSKDGVSPDPSKCDAIKQWPAPKSNKEIKSFLQTVQFNAKFLGGETGEKSYPELTKKNAIFRWSNIEDAAFKLFRLCSNRVLAPYETHRKTRLYVDSSFAGTQATVSQLHLINNKETSRLPCNISLPHNPSVPLQPNLLPDRPWQRLHADFKGPIAGSYYLHILIDQYSKYPEVDIVKSTSFAKLRPVLDRVFATHGIPESLTTDNGPPYSSHEMKEYSQEMGFQLTPVTPRRPAM